MSSYAVKIQCTHVKSGYGTLSQVTKLGLISVTQKQSNCSQYKSFKMRRHLRCQKDYKTPHSRCLLNSLLNLACNYFFAWGQEDSECWTICNHIHAPHFSHLFSMPTRDRHTQSPAAPWHCHKTCCHHDSGLPRWQLRSVSHPSPIFQYSSPWQFISAPSHEETTQGETTPRRWKCLNLLRGHHFGPP